MDKRKADETEPEKKRPKTVSRDGFLMRMRSRGELVGTFAAEVAADVLRLIDLFAKPKRRGVLRDNYYELKRLIASCSSPDFVDINDEDTVCWIHSISTQCVDASFLMRGKDQPYYTHAPRVPESNHARLFGAGLLCGSAGVVYYFWGRGLTVCHPNNSCVDVPLPSWMEPVNMFLDSYNEFLYLPNALSHEKTLRVWKVNTAAVLTGSRVFTLQLPPDTNRQMTLVGMTSEKRFVAFDNTTVLTLREDGQVLQRFTFGECMAFLAIEATDDVLFWRLNADLSVEIVRVTGDSATQVVFPRLSHPAERLLLSPNNTVVAVTAAILSPIVSLWKHIGA